MNCVVGQGLDTCVFGAVYRTYPKFCLSAAAGDDIVYSSGFTLMHTTSEIGTPICQLTCEARGLRRAGTVTSAETCPVVLVEEEGRKKIEVGLVEVPDGYRRWHD